MRLFILTMFCLSLITGTVIPQNNKVLITANRGAVKTTPENTFASMEEAINMHADYSLINVQETSDGEIIVFHDNNLKRITGLDKNVWETPYSIIKTLDAGKWFNAEYSQEPLPKLSDILVQIGKRMKLNIELMTYGHQQKLVEKTIKVIKNNNFSNNCIVSSTDYTEIKKVKELEPSIKVGFIFDKIPDTIDVFKESIDVLCVDHSIIDKEFMKIAKANGKEVHALVVDDEKEMKRLIKLGVTNIITNDPAKLKKILDMKK